MKKYYLFIVYIGIVIIMHANYANCDILWDLENPMVKVYSEKYQTEPIVVVSLAQRMTYENDISTALFVANILEADPVKILNSRIQGKNWMTLLQDNNINMEVLFTSLCKSNNAWSIITDSTISQLKPFMDSTELSLIEPFLNKKFSERELTEKLLNAGFNKEECEMIIFYSILEKLPKIYRRAYKEFEKYHMDQSYNINLYDDEVRNLVQLKFCTEFLNMDPWYVINEHNNGTSYSSIILNFLETENGN